MHDVIERGDECADALLANEAAFLALVEREAGGRLAPAAERLGAAGPPVLAARPARDAVRLVVAAMRVAMEAGESAPSRARWKVVT